MRRGDMGLWDLTMSPEVYERFPISSKKEEQK
jgi:hypothetical protein